ncbi:Tim17-like protein [Tribonema minus]|uniref:Tim17-like protein n=1 Tax=Tribonema minus TaxID=303371 RepID=A0A836CAQ4_9STRA|nr:Tim17-like protein [Tribonema minus]
MSEREPCPYRIIDDVGGAYVFGAVGGGVFHTIKGARNAPKGLNNSWKGSVSAVKARAPVLGGNFAVWGGLFACCDCTMAALRRKEDPWNSIASGAATGGILALRAGPKTAAKNALVGGVLLALIEGMGIGLSRMFAQMKPEDMPAILQEGGGAAPDEGGPKQRALAPPIPFGAHGGGAPGRRHDDAVDPSAPRQSDVMSGSGFDTDSRYADPFAQADPYATSGGLVPEAGGAGAGAPEAPPKRGFFGGLFGRGGK